MKVKALVNFSGQISMCKGQEREIDNQELLNDLSGAGYIEIVPEKVVKSNEAKRTKK